MSNPSFWPLIFLVVSFNKIPLFSKDLITFISFASLLVSDTLEPLYKIYLASNLQPASKRFKTSLSDLAKSKLATTFAPSTATLSPGPLSFPSKVGDFLGLHHLR